MKGACAAALLLVSTAAAAQDGERDAERWICVPSMDSGWRCGRGANAPEPAPLPPEEPPASPPTGYTPPDRDSGLPGYLLDPTLPSPAQEDTADTAAPARPGDSPAGTSGPTQSVTPEPVQPEPTEPTETAETATAAMPQSAENETARTDDADDVGDEAEGDPGAGALTTTPDGTANARYSIQLTAARDRNSLAAYRERLADAGVDVFYRTWEDASGTWHVLLTGRFETVAAARRALEALPDDARGAGAWIRPLASLEP